MKSQILEEISKARNSMLRRIHVLEDMDDDDAALDACVILQNAIEKLEKLEDKISGSKNGRELPRPQSPRASKS